MVGEVNNSSSVSPILHTIFVVLKYAHLSLKQSNLKPKGFDWYIFKNAIQSPLISIYGNVRVANIRARKFMSIQA